MDRLNPADMPAVLERTVLRPSVENFLLPMYESLSNSIYSIDERWKTEAMFKGKMRLEITTASFSAKVIDNGIGLNSLNYEKFKTPFTNHRLKKLEKALGVLSVSKFLTEFVTPQAIMKETKSSLETSILIFTEIRKLSLSSFRCGTSMS